MGADSRIPLDEENETVEAARAGDGEESAGTCAEAAGSAMQLPSTAAEVRFRGSQCLKIRELDRRMIRLLIAVRVADPIGQ